MSKFKVGQKVKCINAIGYLVEGEEYTISKVWDGGEINVKECIPPKGFNCYNKDRFRFVSIDVNLTFEDVRSITDMLVLCEQVAYLEDSANIIALKLNKAIGNETV